MIADSFNELAAEGLCQAKLQLGKWEDVEVGVKGLSHAPALAELLRLEAAVGKSGGQDLLSSLSQNTPNCPEAWYRLGRLYLADESPNLACTAFLKVDKN